MGQDNSKDAADPTAAAAVSKRPGDIPIPAALQEAAQKTIAAQQGQSISEANAARVGFDPSSHEKLKDNRYRPASPAGERYFYASQPANREGGAAADFKSNLQVGAEAQKATIAAQVIADEVAKQGGKLTVIDNSWSRQEIIKVLSETEGLNISKRKRDELSKQWRFFLTTDPVQHGLDAGFVTGSLLAAWSVRKIENRAPLRVTAFWGAGFAVGMMLFPLAMIAWEEYNMSKILRNEKEMFKRQREDFYASGRAQDPPEIKL